MHLVLADDFEAVRVLYIEVAGNTPDIEKYARWVYGKHPTDEMLRSYIDDGEMYLLTDGNDIVGMAAVVMHQGEDYHAVPWAEKLADDQVATIHLLAVRPGCRGRAFGGIILEEAERLASENGKKALRLDVLESNIPARRMYEKAGYSYRGKQYLYAENTGHTYFLYYEKTLDDRKEDRQ